MPRSRTSKRGFKDRSIPKPLGLPAVFVQYCIVMVIFSIISTVIVIVFAMTSRHFALFLVLPWFLQ